MELKQCPACNKDVSSEAEVCVNCGHPLKETQNKNTKKKTAPWAWVFLGIFIALGIAYFTSNSFKESYRPKMPITLKHKAAFLDNDTRVITISNLSTNTIKIIATFERPSSGNIKTETIQLSANESESFGKLQGWAFKSGDKVTLKSDKYRRWEGRIP